MNTVERAMKAASGHDPRQRRAAMETTPAARETAVKPGRPSIRRTPSGGRSTWRLA
jgi:hypothetical protein